MQLHHCVIAWPRLGQTTVIKNVNQSPEVLDFILVENDHFWGGFQCKRPPNRRVVKKQSHAKPWDVDLKWNAWKWMELQGFKGNKNEWSEHNPYRLNSTQTLEFPLFSMDFTPIGFPQFCMGLFFNYPQIMHWKPPRDFLLAWHRPEEACPYFVKTDYFCIVERTCEGAKPTRIHISAVRTSWTMIIC